jgi:CheY-like chemotaxis protein
MAGSEHDRREGGALPLLLVIDDMPGVGASIRVILHGRCEVLAVTEPAEALQALRGTAPIQAVLCDVQLPGTTVGALAQQIRALRPDLAERLLLMTGGSFPDDEPGFPQVGAPLRLLKPFAPEQLLRALAVVGVLPGARG